VLDDAMHKLGEKDRVAVLLRYFQNKSLKEVGKTLGLSENAARMRVDRALEKLRAQLARKGVTSTASGLALTLTGNAAMAAPTAFVATLTSASLLSAAAASGTTLTLMKLMTMTKIKTGVISSIVVAGAVTSLVIQQQSQAKIRESDGALQQQADQLARLQTERERLSNLLARANGPAAEDRLSELLRLRAEAVILSQQTNDLAALQEENHRMREQNAQQADPLKTPLQLKDETNARSRAAKDFLLAFILYAMDNQNQFPASFDQAVRYFPDAFNADPVSGDLAEFIQATNQFEIVYRGSRDALTNAGNVMVLRERQARQWPDGKWSKVYGFADGHSETHSEAEGNFDIWEKQRIVTPANQ
jgi:hypothetical protein